MNKFVDEEIWGMQFIFALWKANHGSLVTGLLVQFLNDVLQDIETSHQQIMQEVAD